MSQWAALAVIGLLGTWAVLVIVSGTAPRLDGVSGTAQAAAASPVRSISRPVCDGDGTSGSRVQALYVRAVSGPDHYASLLPGISGTLTQAGVLGGHQHVRFVHGPDCAPAVANVVVPPAALSDLGQLTAALRSMGFDRDDRMYVLWHEGAGCAVTSGNFAALGPSCWSPPSAAEYLQRLASAPFVAP